MTLPELDHRDHQGIQEDLERAETTERLWPEKRHQDPQDAREKWDHPDRPDHQDHVERTDLQERKDLRETWEIRGRTESRDNRESLERRDRLERRAHATTARHRELLQDTRLFWSLCCLILVDKTSNKLFFVHESLFSKKKHLCLEMKRYTRTYVGFVGSFQSFRMT